MVGQARVVEEGLETEVDKGARAGPEVDKGARVGLTGQKARAGPAGQTSEVPDEQLPRRVTRAEPEGQTNEAPAEKQPGA